MPPSPLPIDTKRLERSERYQFAVSLIHCLPARYLIAGIPSWLDVFARVLGSMIVAPILLSYSLINKERFVSFVSDLNGGSRPPRTLTNRKNRIVDQTL